MASPRVQVSKAQPKRANGVAGIQGARRSVAAARQTLAYPDGQPTRSSRFSFRPAGRQSLLSPQRPRASRQSARRSMLAPTPEQREPSRGASIQSQLSSPSALFPQNSRNAPSFGEPDSLFMTVPQSNASRYSTKKQSIFGQALDVTRRKSSRRSTVAPGVVQQTTTTALAPAAQDLFLILACGAVHDLMDLNTYVRPRPPP